MGKAFDEAKNDDSFYLPPEVFDNPDFQRGMKSFFSPDGKTVRMIIAHRGDPLSPEGLSRVEPIKVAAIEAVKGTPLGGREDLARRHGGDVQGHGGRLEVRPADRRNRIDLFDLSRSCCCSPKSLVAALVIVGTVVLSLGASFGPFGPRLAAHPRHRIALDGAGDVGDHPAGRRIRLQPVAGVPLQGGDTRRAEDRHHPRDGRHRQRGDRRGPRVRADDVLDGGQRSARFIGQMGTTIGLGLLFDTFVVRSFMVPSIATLLGRWFWWPMNVRTRPPRSRPAPADVVAG